MATTSVEDGQPMGVLNQQPFRQLHDEDDVGSDENFTLPLAGHRNGKWWYSTYHNVTAIVGAGVLGLPTSMVYLGWGAGTVVLVLSWVITLFTLWQMVEMHEVKDEKGQLERIDTYYQLGQKAFGPKLGLWIVLPQQIVVQVGLNIVYMLTGGHALWHFYQLIHCPEINLVAVGGGDRCCGKLGRSTFTIFFAMFQLFCAQLGDFNSIASVSLLSCVMSICYCAMASIDSLHLGRTNHSNFADPTKPLAVCPTSYQFSHDATSYSPHITDIDEVFGVFSALGVVAFAYGGHNVVLEIQATLPSSSKHPSKVRMWRGVMVAYIIVAICYFPVAFAGYWAFGTYLTFRGASPGNPKSGNILLQLGEPRGLIATANLFVAIHVTGGYLVYAMPMFELMEKILVKRFRCKPTQPGCTSVMRIVTRSTYVLLTAFIALTFPFFNDLLSFVGGFALTPTTYFLPCIIWLKMRKPKVFSKSWMINWVLIVIGTLLTIVASIGGLRSLIVDSSDLKQGVTVARASPQEYEWIQQQREIQTQGQAQASRRQTISALPAILVDPETMRNHPKIKYFLTIPLNFIPFFGQALFCWLNAMETATVLHHFYYSDLKGLSAEDEAVMIHSRKAEYIEFGLVASALTLLPGLNVILILTNAIGAALWIADIERAIQLQQ